MTNEMISISPSPHFLNYVAIFHLHLQMVFISRIWFGIQELFDVRTVFVYPRQSTDEQVNVKGASIVSSQAAFRKFYGRYHDLVWQYKLPLCQMLSVILILKPFLTYWSWLRFASFSWPENRAQGGCDRSTGVLTPPRYLIQPVVYSESHVYISYRSWEIGNFSLFMLFHRVVKPTVLFEIVIPKDIYK
jgi:hypothetical protein